MELSAVTRADPPCPPSDKLLHLTIEGIRNDMPKDQNLYTDIICGIDLEYETEGTSLAPEPASYETAYVTSHKQACRSGAFSHDGQLVATGSVDASIKVRFTLKNYILVEENINLTSHIDIGCGSYAGKVSSRRYGPVTW